MGQHSPSRPATRKPVFICTASNQSVGPGIEYTIPPWYQEIHTKPCYPSECRNTRPYKRGEEGNTYLSPRYHHQHIHTLLQEYANFLVKAGFKHVLLFVSRSSEQYRVCIECMAILLASYPGSFSHAWGCGYYSTSLLWCGTCIITRDSADC